MDLESPVSNLAIWPTKKHIESGCGEETGRGQTGERYFDTTHLVRSYALPRRRSGAGRDRLADTAAGEPQGRQAKSPRVFAA